MTRIGGYGDLLLVVQKLFFLKLNRDDRYSKLSLIFSKRVFCILCWINFQDNLNKFAAIVHPGIERKDSE
jgi:hypothetical protein